MKEAKDKIDLIECGIERGKGPGIKRALTGALTFEFAGPEGHIHADKVAQKLREVFHDKEGIRVTRPMKMAEMRVRDLEDSIKPDEVRYVITQEGDCHHDEVKVGTIKRGNDGLGVIWVRCPLSAANKIAEKGRIQIGWTNARVALLEPRPLQCFKCLEGGHVRAQCKSNTDRSSRCYRCGKDGHKAQECNEAPKCPVCTDLGRPANHRAGNRACTSAHGRRKMGPQVKTTKGIIREPPKAVEKTSREEPAASTELMDTWEEPKPQRITRARLQLRPKEVELVKDKLVDDEVISQQPIGEKTQDSRDREKRAAKSKKANQKVTRRSSDSEGEKRSFEPKKIRTGRDIAQL